MVVEREQPQPALARVSVDEAKRLLDEGHVYLDVRTVEEFDAGHAPGAYNIPWMTRGPRGLELNPDFLPVFRASFTEEDKVLVACQAGGRSRRAAICLLDADFFSVVDMRPGYGGIRDAFGRTTEQGWAAAGMPVVYGAEGRGYDDLLARLG